MTESPEQKRFSRLAPLLLSDQVKLCLAALHFFSPMSYEKNCLVIERPPTPGRTEPFDGSEFLKYLERERILAHPNRYRQRIAGLLRRLEHTGLLVPLGHGRDVFLGTRYYFIKEFTKIERKGILWLSEALGPQFIRSQYAPFTVQITGETESGDVHAGTGLVIAENWILTCAHVLKDMKVHDQQAFNGQARTVTACRPHSSVDVGLIRVEPPMSVMLALAFREPSISESLYTLGYPRVPLAKSASLVMQSGEVTSTGVALLHGPRVFLYSAIARPGNSGGPIISSAGHVLGIVTEELHVEAESAAAPFHAGIDSETIRLALVDLEPSIVLPVEDYE